MCWIRSEGMGAFEPPSSELIRRLWGSKSGMLCWQNSERESWNFRAARWSSVALLESVARWGTCRVSTIPYGLCLSGRYLKHRYPQYPRQTGRRIPNTELTARVSSEQLAKQVIPGSWTQLPLCWELRSARAFRASMC